MSGESGGYLIPQHRVKSEPAYLEERMDLLKLGIAVGGVFCTPLFQGVLLAAFLFCTNSISSYGQLKFRADLWLRAAAHLMAASFGTKIALALMHAVGYDAGWIWTLLVSAYFIQNYYFRHSRGILTPDEAFLLIFDVLGIWASDGLLRA